MDNSSQVSIHLYIQLLLHQPAPKSVAPFLALPARFRRNVVIFHILFRFSSCQQFIQLYHPAAASSASSQISCFAACFSAKFKEPPFPIIHKIKHSQCHYMLFMQLLHQPELPNQLPLCLLYQQDSQHTIPIIWRYIMLFKRALFSFSNVFTNSNICSFKKLQQCSISKI